ncbi:hypothetical protein [Spiroplasma endosymbiont of Dasysyrphus albostriatus]|uniref:hypothetical protein n=1 Tax=Spiroplasma endosymbiont of Dasysyrphus albostriatus TaxID=3066299 RepID=UPI0030D02778
MKNHYWIWWKLRKGMGIKVQIPNDIDKETGKQKYRPAIVIKSYPSHVKVQLLSTQPNKNNYYKITVNNKIGYVRAIYHITISFNLIQSLWFERGQKVFINSDSVFFQKIIEMEYKEIFDKELNLHQLHEEIQELRNEIELLRNSKLKNRHHG